MIWAVLALDIIGACVCVLLHQIRDRLDTLHVLALKQAIVYLEDRQQRAEQVLQARQANHRVSFSASKGMN